MESRRVTNLAVELWHRERQGSCEPLDVFGPRPYLAVLDARQLRVVHARAFGKFCLRDAAKLAPVLHSLAGSKSHASHVALSATHVKQDASNATHWHARMRHA